MTPRWTSTNCRWPDHADVGLDCWPGARWSVTTGRCISRDARSTWTASGRTSARWQPTCWLGRRPGARGRPRCAGLRARRVVRPEAARSSPDDDSPDLQRLAAATAVLRSVSVIAGGPGTGKTTTVARVLALLDAQAVAAGRRPPLVALAAPTGKAAARLEEAVRNEAAAMPVGDDVKERLRALQRDDPAPAARFQPAATAPGSATTGSTACPTTSWWSTRPRWCSLSLMARLVEAVRPDARLILVGDPEQLASVEAGAVLGDIVGPAAQGLCISDTARTELAEVTGKRRPAGPAVRGTRLAAIGDGIVVLRDGAPLRRGHRRVGRCDPARGGRRRHGGAGSPGDQRRVDRGGCRTAFVARRRLGTVRTLAVDGGAAVLEAARAGDAGRAIAALGDFRLLCAHRRGPDGVAAWMQHVENWLRAEVDGFAAAPPRARAGTWVGR